MIVTRVVFLCAFASLCFKALPAQAQSKRDVAGLSVYTRAKFLPNEETAVDITDVAINDLAARGPARELFHILKSFVPRDESATAAERYNLAIEGQNLLYATNWTQQGKQKLSAHFSDTARSVSIYSDAEQHEVVIYNESLVEAMIPVMKNLGYPVQTGPSWQRGVSVSGRFVTCSNKMTSMSSRRFCSVSLKNPN
ncbi:MAG: hypothetical protein NT027_17835 [Proteobacteria bacterium]|nr:hypothetical protein [Pseudomonadota bacterium]